MNFLKEMKARGVVNESLLPLVFGENLSNLDYWYNVVDMDLPRLSRDVLLLYLGLTQAYSFAMAQRYNKTLTDVTAPAKIIKPIAQIWDVGAEDRFSTNGDLFSYFVTGADCKEKNIFGDRAGAVLHEVYNAYKIYFNEGNSRETLTPIKRELFFEFLEALPLLKHTVFDPETMKLKFVLPDVVLQIKAAPFISFLTFDNAPIGEPVDFITSNCYILLSVQKGEANNELFFQTVRLDETGSVIDKRCLRRQVRDNEYLTLLCKTANIKTQWYAADDCWCDLKFLNKMVDASEEVLLSRCNITSKEYQKECDICQNLKRLFENTDLYNNISKRFSVKVKDLNELLFELFLTEGLFSTVRCIILNSLMSNDTSEDMFKLYLNALSSSCNISPDMMAAYEEACENKIALALEKLSHIVSQKYQIYRRRAMEICAEWKTYFILQAAGIKRDKLFADVETNLSIDDYYNMISNTSSTLETDLMQLLRMLCVFFAALLENCVPFDEEKYYESAKRIVAEYDAVPHTLESSFDCFIEIAQRCERVPHMEELLGRRGLGVGAVEYLEYCKKQILTEMHNRLPRAMSGSAGHGIFVSYAHEDLDKVKPIIERWRERGFSFFFDESDIHDGQNWQKRAEEAMDHHACKLVVAFFSKNSVCKKAVAQEIKHAHVWRSVKYPEDREKQTRFLLPINLEAEPIETYLTHAAHHHPGVDKERVYAKQIEECVSGKDVFINYNENDERQFDDRILADYEYMAGKEGSVVTMFDSFELAIANFYAFLKYGKTVVQGIEEIHDYFNDEHGDFARCIFPIVTSVKEASIKRDNIAIVGYELINGKGKEHSCLSHILTSRTLEIDDYYCIPKYRNSSEIKHWMIEPLLIQCDKFTEILTNTRDKENG